MFAGSKEATLILSYQQVFGALFSVPFVCFKHSFAKTELFFYKHSSSPSINQSINAFLIAQVFGTSCTVRIPLLLSKLENISTTSRGTSFV